MAKKNGTGDWSHKTLEPCECGFLQRSADDPDLPVEFDSRMNEFQFVYHRADGVQGSLRLRHCPFCGGKAPESRRATLFAVIPSAEEQRLLTLTQPLKTVDQVVAAFGSPDNEHDLGLISTSPECNRQPPTTQGFRTLIYRGLSDVADVHVRVDSLDRAVICLQGKYVGEKSTAA